MACCLLVGACSNDDQSPSGSHEVKIKASVEQKNAATRTDESALPDGDYHLYLPLGSFNDSEQIIKNYSCSNKALTATNSLPLFWDDIKAAANKSETTFYFTNTLKTSFDDITKDDIMWGGTKGWLGDLDFKMTHSMSKFSIVLVDKSLTNDLGFDKAKASLKSGLIRKIEAFDFTTGKVTTASADLREAETILDADVLTKGTKDGYPTITLPLSIVPPQDFAAGTKLKITTDKFVFEIDLPSKMKMKDESDNEVEVDIELRPGEHLTMEITLTEEEIDFTAKLVNWETKTANPIEVTRVFNISNWNELKDLMLAINTGYTFEGMVVRLTNDIYAQGQISLGNEENPFKGIFDGNKSKIYDIGIHDNENGNKGGFFGLTKGATLQNITIISPEISAGENNALGVLVDKAEDTTIFNCWVRRDDRQDKNDRIGLIKGKNNYVGGMVGIGVGKTSLNNCYSIINVENSVDNEYVGGLIGYSEGTITHCSAQGFVHANGSDYVGGLAGYTSNNVLHCYAWGEAKGRSKVGGLIGFVDGSVSNSYASGEVSGNANEYGGLFGNLGFNGTAKYCFWYNSGSVPGTGAATLDATCQSFPIATDQSGIISGLNEGYDTVWVLGLVDNKQAIFK